MTRFSTEEKIQAVIRYQKGSVSLKSIAKSIELHHSVFSNWIRQYEYYGEEAFKNG
ncbi:transposase [Paenibacillus macquariensis subsp. defensor]|nr:transposase [Paenibacillus macquariensis subsp. defensor]